MNSYFNIGVTVFVVRDNKLLLGKRKGDFGAGEWGLPGGHLKFNEKLEDAGLRELKEETGMSAEKLVFENLVNQPGKTEHYIHIGFTAINSTGEPELCEPDECEEWKWFDLDGLPENIFSIQAEMVNLYKNRNIFAEGGIQTKVI